MAKLQIKPAEACRFDLASLGEVMLRLDPGEGRVRTARQFRVWEGGGEYNVARGLRRCFGLRTALVSAFVENDVGRLLEDCVLQGGVDMTFVNWLPFDGTGRTARNGLNFTERGFGVRGAAGTSDRANSAASQMKPGDVDWDELFGKLGVCWFHTGGIFAGLSESTAALAEEALTAARKYVTVTSYDLNYRPSLWESRGGREKAREVNRRLAPLVDVMLGVDDTLIETKGDPERMIEEAAAAYPNFKAVAATLRKVHSATVNDWGAVCWYDGELHRAAELPGLEVLDRVGGGDSFASGLIYGFLTTGDPSLAVNYGAAHGALAMTTPGDTSMASLAEVERLMRGVGAGVDR